MSRSKKETKPIKVYSMNSQDIDVKRVARVLVEMLKNHPERVDEDNEKIEKEKNESSDEEIINKENFNKSSKNNSVHSGHINNFEVLMPMIAKYVQEHPDEYEKYLEEKKQTAKK